MKNEKLIARLSGLAYLAIFISGFFANFYVLEGLVVKGDMQLTHQNFIENPVQFSQGIGAFVLMILLDILLAIPLYKLLQDENKKLALISSTLRLVNGLYFIFALSFLVDIYIKLSQKPAILESVVEASLNSFNLHWAIGLIIFGLHLLVLGSLVRKSKKFPYVIGVLLSLAGIGYLLDSAAQIGFFSDENIEALLANMVVVTGVLGEMSFTLFLLIKGVRSSEK
jgi:hypothetical protein